jgi:hypothetical protein
VLGSRPKSQLQAEFGNTIRNKTWSLKIFLLKSDFADDGASEVCCRLLPRVLSPPAAVPSFLIIRILLIMLGTPLSFEDDLKHQSCSSPSRVEDEN